MKINFITNIFEHMNDEFKCPDLPAGSADWSKDDRSLIFICPCGCQKLRTVPVEGKQKWNWDGNRELPTLTPSIKIVGECGWHGFLTKGEWKTV